MRKALALLLSLALFPALSIAETVHISNLTSIVFDIPQGWVKASEPPEPLLEILAEHIGHETLEKTGTLPGQEQLIEAAEKRMASNEVIIYNPQTNAHMTLDFSMLRAGEKAPSKKAIKLSAEYAGQSLEQEEGVTGLQGESQETTVSGAWYAYRYDAGYRHHEEEMHFSGVIGFISPYWFYFYFTDFKKDPGDQEKAEQLLNSINIVKRKP